MSIETAYRLYFQNKKEEAKRIVKRIIERSPNPKALFLYALINYQDGDLIEAEWAIDEATELDPNFYEAFILKAKILRKLKRYKEALEALNQAQEAILNIEDYTDYETFILKAEIYLDLGNIDKASEALSFAKELNPLDDDLISLEKKIREAKKK